MAEKPDRPSIPTEPSPTDIPRQRRARAARRVFVVAVMVFLGFGAFNAYGVRTRTASGTAGGYELSVRYASVSRPGLATPWSFEVRRPGGFPDGLTVAVTSSYFDAFDENGFDPSPVEETNDGERTIWRFAPPAGDTLAVSFDGRIEPGVQLTRVKGKVEVLDVVDEQAVLVTVGFRTLVMP